MKIRAKIVFDKLNVIACNRIIIFLFESIKSKEFTSVDVDVFHNNCRKWFTDNIDNYLYRGSMYFDNTSELNVQSITKADEEFLLQDTAKGGKSVIALIKNIRSDINEN